MKNDIIFVDTETTNLIGAMGNKIEFQPYMIEIYVVRTNHKLKILDEFNSLIKPPVHIPHFITRITGINDITVTGEPTFKETIKPIMKIMKGAETFVAHNATFDYDMVRFEFERANKKFKMPKHLYCTVEQSNHLKGYRLKNLELYEILTGKTDIINQHRAKADTLATMENYKILKGGFKCH